MHDPGARGEGAGSQIVTVVGDWAAACGADRLRLAALLRNRRGLAFWHGHGLGFGFGEVASHGRPGDADPRFVALE